MEQVKIQLDNGISLHGVPSPLAYFMCFFLIQHRYVPCINKFPNAD